MRSAQTFEVFKSDLAFVSLLIPSQRSTFLSHKAIEQNLLGKFSPKLKREEHNQWHRTLNDLGTRLATTRSKLLIEHFKNALGESEEFKSRIELEIFKARDMISNLKD